MIVIHGPLASGKLTVALTVSGAEQARRIDDPARHAFGKFTSRAMLESLRASGAFDAAPLLDQGLSIDTAVTPPKDAAARIAAHFGLA